MKRHLGLAALAAWFVQACAAPPPTPPVRDAALERTIVEAAAIPGHAGHYVEDGVLHIGFTPRGMAAAQHLAKAHTVRLFAAEHDMAELEAAFAWARRMLLPADYGPLTVEIDKRRNALAVGTAYELIDPSPDVRCTALKPLPKEDPVHGVPILDRRDCTR